MKIAITADAHLKTYGETEERYEALENIFEQIRLREISHFVIAGDLFDKDFSNYSDFDSLCKQFSSVNVVVIPGNHDFQIDNRYFTASNIEIIKEVQVKELDRLSAVFIPYDSAKSIDEALSEYTHREKIPDRWILFGHGDYITGKRELNPYEQGFYMPFSHKSINKFNPLKVFLGHIHKPSNFGRVFYPGSPCSLDINETGKRRFLVYDTVLDNVEDVYVSTEKIYFNEFLTILPFEEEEQFLKRKLEKMIEGWNLKIDELNKVSIRLSLKGYVRDLKESTEIIEKFLSSYGIKLYDKEGIHTSGVKILKEVETDRLYLLEKIQEKIETLKLNWETVSKEKILEKAMEFIFEQ